MKYIICSLLVLSQLTIACGKKENDNSNAAEDNAISTTETRTTADTSATTQAETLQETEAGTSASAAGPGAGFSTDGIIAAYLKLADALANDNAKAAAQAGKALFGEFNKIDANAIAAKKRADYLDIAADAKEHAEHISHNASDIAHQREHLAILSKDISDLVSAFGHDGELYQAHCPMYSDGKGAIWVSATKEIRNPYYGKEMLSCGSIKKEL